MAMINEGVLVSQRGLGACSVAMTDAEVDRFVEVLGRVLDQAGSRGQERSRQPAP